MSCRTWTCPSAPGPLGGLPLTANPAHLTISPAHPSRLSPFRSWSQLCSLEYWVQSLTLPSTSSATLSVGEVNQKPHLPEEVNLGWETDGDYYH